MSQSKRTKSSGIETDEFLEEFLQEKARIKQIVGQVGGKTTKKNKLGNATMLVFIILTFVIAPFLPHNFELPAIEIGLAILSLKIFFMLHNSITVTHFQFWMLSSLEWRMDEMSKRLIRMEKGLKKLSENVEQET